MLKNNTHNRTSGFTIVELLIVIVIIGILATLVITTFSGIQEAARNTKRIQAAKAYETMLASYNAQYGNYPAFTGRICLGTNYDDYNGDGVGDCRILNGSAANLASINESFNEDLSQIVKSLPDTELRPVTSFGDLRRGLSLEIDDIRPVNGTDPLVMTYWLEGPRRDCGLTVWARQSGTYLPTTNDYSASSDAGTTCFVLLPQ